jgi:hypothetical protein
MKHSFRPTFAIIAVLFLGITPALPAAVPPGTLEVDLGDSWGPAQLRASGMLWGLSETQPSDALLDPLKLQVFRGRLTPWISGSGIHSMVRMYNKGARIQAVLSDEYYLDPRSAGRLNDRVNGPIKYERDDGFNSGGFAYNSIIIWPLDKIPADEQDVIELLPAPFSDAYVQQNFYDGSTLKSKSEVLAGISDPDTNAFVDDYFLWENGDLLIDMTFIWDDVVDRSYQRIQDAGIEAEWDFWEEPGNKAWFRPFVDRDDNWQRYYEVYVHTYNRIKALDPDATIIGPSAYRYDWDNGPFIKNFLLYAQANSAVPEGLAWHELMEGWHNPSQIPGHVEDMRNFLATNNISIETIDIGEIVSDDRDDNSAMYLWYISKLEEAQVSSSCRAVWREPDGSFNGWSPMLGGLLTSSLQPRSNYWVHKHYADITGNLFAVNEDAQVLTGFAGFGDTEEELRILVARINYDGASAADHYVSVKNTGTFPWMVNGQRVNVTAKRIPNTGYDPLSGPEAHTLAQSQFVISGNHLTIPLGSDAEGFEEYATLELIVTPEFTPPTRLDDPYLVQVDFEDLNATPVTGGYWNEIGDPLSAYALKDTEAALTPLSLSMSNMDGGWADLSNDFDFEATEWGTSAQDCFTGPSVDTTISCTLSGFSATDTVIVELIAVGAYERVMDIRVNGNFGDAGAASNGENYNSLDAHDDGIVATWSGLTGATTYTLTAQPVNGQWPLISALRVTVQPVIVDTDLDGLPDTFEVAKGFSAELSDSDGDGIDDLTTYALGGNHFASAFDALPELHNTLSGNIYELPHTQAEQIEYEVFMSTDLVTWYRVAVKAPDGAWMKDTTDDETPVFPDVAALTVLSTADGVTLTDPSGRTVVFFRCEMNFVP